MGLAEKELSAVQSRTEIKDAVENIILAGHHAERPDENHEPPSPSASGRALASSALCSDDGVAGDDLDSLIQQLYALPIAELYPDLAKEVAERVLPRWKRAIFSEKVWTKLTKKTQGPVPRILKELNEAAPVIEMVRSWTSQQSEDAHHSSRSQSYSTDVVHDYGNRFGDEEKADTRTGECEPSFSYQADQAEEKDDVDHRFTVVDLGSGLGYLSLFLAELCVPQSIKQFVMVDHAWPRRDRPETETDGKHLSTGHVEEFNQFYGSRELVPTGVEEGSARNGEELHLHRPRGGPRRHPILRHLKMDLKASHDLDDLRHFVFLNGDKHTRRLPEAERDSAMSSLKKSRVVLLGVHLCGSLSLRAAQLAVQNPDVVEYACIKPCCLPSTKQLAQEARYRVGRTQFAAKDVFLLEDQREHEQQERVEEDHTAMEVNGCYTTQRATEDPSFENHDVTSRERARENDGSAGVSAGERQHVTQRSGNRTEKVSFAFGKRRFDNWCGLVFKCLRQASDGVGDEGTDGADDLCVDVGDATVVSKQTIRVAPHYFQNQFLVLERRRNPPGDSYVSDRTGGSGLRTEPAKRHVQIVIPKSVWQKYGG